MSADVLYMSDAEEPSTPAQSESSRPGPKREKRKPRIDAGGLNALFKEYAYQEHTDLVWSRRAREPVKVAALRLQYGNDAVRVWLNSPKRVMITKEQIVFDPSQACSKECINLYEPDDIKPEMGDVEPFMAVLRHMCDDDEDAIDYLLNWCAYPLQHRGHKMKTALVVHGDEGTGKNFIFEAIAAMHGKHGKIVGQRELESQWNDWASACTFLIGDEVVSRTEMRHHKGVLKALVTSEKINISTKFLNLRTESNCMNLVFLSNEVQPLVLDPSDRRYFVIWTAQRGSDELYRKFVAWRDGGGLAALKHMLLTRDLSAWEWWSPPPLTQAKKDLIELGRPGAERFVRDWMAGEIAGLPWQACSSDQAFKAYQIWSGLEGDRWPQNKPNFTRMARRVAPALRVQVAKMADKTTARVWCPADPVLRDGQTFSDWAVASIRSFDETLKNWRFSRLGAQESGK